LRRFGLLTKSGDGDKPGNSLRIDLAGEPMVELGFPTGDDDLLDLDDLAVKLLGGDVNSATTDRKLSSWNPGLQLEVEFVEFVKVRVSLPAPFASFKAFAAVSICAKACHGKAVDICVSGRHISTVAA
jgi:hypothetical protein